MPYFFILEHLVHAFFSGVIKVLQRSLEKKKPKENALHRACCFLKKSSLNPKRGGKKTTKTPNASFTYFWTYKCFVFALSHSLPDVFMVHSNKKLYVVSKLLYQPLFDIAFLRDLGDGMFDFTHPHLLGTITFFHHCFLVFIFMAFSMWYK